MQPWCSPVNTPPCHGGDRRFKSGRLRILKNPSLLKVKGFSISVAGAGIAIIDFLHTKCYLFIRYSVFKNGGDMEKSEKKFLELIKEFLENLKIEEIVRLIIIGREDIARKVIPIYLAEQNLARKLEKGGALTEDVSRVNSARAEFIISSTSERQKNLSEIEDASKTLKMLWGKNECARAIAEKRLPFLFF